MQDISNQNTNGVEDEFEFTFACRDSDTSLSLSADEIFSDGQIRPILPVLGANFLPKQQVDSSSTSDSNKLLTNVVVPSSRRLPLRELFIEDDASSSSETDESDRMHGAGNYCVWTPRTVPISPETCKKSYSTGSPKRFRLIDLIQRSNSDVSETYVFHAPLSSTTAGCLNSSTGEEKQLIMEKKNQVLYEAKNVIKAKKNKGTSTAASGGNARVLKGYSPHEIYLRNRATEEGERRQTYLPYRRDIIGFFANLNGWNRKLYPPFHAT